MLVVAQVEPSTHVGACEYPTDAPQPYSPILIRTDGDLSYGGESLGVAFQIADDLLDEDQDEGCSLLRVADADAARARSESLLERALDAIRALGACAEPLRSLARYAVRRSE